MVGSYCRTDQNVINAFTSGATDAVPGIRVVETESHDLEDPMVCEKIANHQIDRGSRVVFADSGACGAGALEASAANGVWAVAGAEDPSNLTVEPWILGSTTKNFGQAVGYAIQSYLNHTLVRRQHMKHWATLGGLK